MGDRSWFGPHSDARRALSAPGEMGDRGRKASTYSPSGGLEGIASALTSRSERYLSARQQSQFYSNDAVLRHVEKLTRKGKKGLKAVAWADEARARGLTLPAGAPAAAGRVDDGHGAANALVSLGGLGLALGAGSAAGLTIGDRSGKGPLSGMQPVVERLGKQHGVKVQVAPDPDHFNPGTNTVSVRPQSHRSVLAHELGHATPPGSVLTKAMKAGYAPARVASMFLTPALVAGAVAHGYDTSLQTKEEALKDTKRGQAVAAGSALLGAPFLVEEARATANGTKYLNELFGKKEALRGLARLTPAYATYGVAAAGAPALGIYALRRKQKKLEQSIARERKAPEMKKAASALLAWVELQEAKKAG